MNVAFITTSYPSNRAPVSGMFVKKLVEGLSLGHGVNAMVFSPKRFPKNIKRHRPNEYLNPSVTVSYPRFIFNDFINKKFEFGFSYFLKKVALNIVKEMEFNNYKPDLIYAHFAFPNALIAKYISDAIRVPFIVNLGESSFSNIPPNLKQHINVSLAQADKVLAVSHHVKNSLYESGFGGFDVEVIHNGVDESIFYQRDKETARAALGIRKDAFVIAYTGSLIERKGFFNLLAALPKLPENVILICATGSKPIVSSRLPICRRFCQESLAEMLSAADLFVFPSGDEGMPNALLEAISVGLPTVLLDRPFNKEILGVEEAIYLPDNSTESLISGINHALLNISVLEQLSMLSKKKSENFYLTKRILKIYRVMKEVVYET